MTSGCRIEFGLRLEYENLTLPCVSVSSPLCTTQLVVNEGDCTNLRTSLNNIPLGQNNFSCFSFVEHANGLKLGH